MTLVFDEVYTSFEDETDNVISVKDGTSGSVGTSIKDVDGS